MVAHCTVYATMRGDAHTKSGTHGRAVSREESREHFCVVIAIYVGVSVALIMVF